MKNTQLPKPTPAAPPVANLSLPGQVNPNLRVASTQTAPPTVQTGIRPSQPGATQAPATNSNPSQIGSGPTIQATSPTIKSPQAQKKKSGGGFFILLIVLILLLVGGYFILNLFGKNLLSKLPFLKQKKEVSLIYWGLWEDEKIYQEVFDEYEAAHEGVTITFVKQSFKDYRERLQAAINDGSGPDIFRYHASWVPMLKNELSAVPEEVMTLQEFKTTYYPVAAEQLTAGNSIYGLPLMFDGLALYYNKDILEALNIAVPTTWSDLADAANNLTVPSVESERSDATIQRGGLAIGNATNVEHFADILALLTLQNEGNLADPMDTKTGEAITFYTKFLTDYKVWSNSLPNSTVAFARGEAAMMFAPSWRAFEIAGMNPNLRFGLAPVPKLGENTLSIASYWAEGVNKKSEVQQEAWEFLKYLSSKESLRKMYSAASQDRLFGEIYPRVDMATELSSDELPAALLNDAPNATSWYMNSFTHDNGVNDEMIKYYENAITATLEGKSSQEVTETLKLGIDEVIKKYSL